MSQIPSNGGTATAAHAELPVGNGWTRMDVPGGWIYCRVMFEANTRTAHVTSVFVPEPFTVTEDDIKHESGKLRFLKALLPLVGRLIRR